MSSGNGSSQPIFDLHDRRLDVLEDAQRELLQKMATFEAQQEYIVKQIDNLPDQIVDRMGLSIGIVQERSTEAHTTSKKALEAVEEIDERIDTLEEAEKRRGAFKKGLKKITVPLLLAAGGAVATGIGQWIWSLISGD